MTNANSSPKISKKQKFKSKNTNNIEQGITKRLLEKYKAKDLCNIATMSVQNDQRRVA